MSMHGSWKATFPGRLALLIGGVKFAVPMLALAAVAMIWGTWIDSTEGRDVAFDRVYASWWFVALMALICASLILSVAVRYPWRKKHVGFIIVHASLVALIGIGFFTMFTKVEGRIILEEGGRAESQMQMQQHWLQILEHTNDRGFVPVAVGIVGKGSTLDLRDEHGQTVQSVQITDRWANSEEVPKITNDGSTPFHAVEIMTRPDQPFGDWIGEAQASEAPVDLGPFSIRVVPTGEVWSPPTEGPHIVLIDPDGEEHPLAEVGQTLGDSGWTVTSIERFERATLGANNAGLIERDAGGPNAASQILLTHTDGSVERQIAFERFRDSPFPRQMEGETASGWVLTYRGGAVSGATLAVMRDEQGKVSALYAHADGTRETFENDGTWPWEFTVQGTPVKILQDFDRARRTDVLEELPEADSTSPVLVVTAEGAEGEAKCRWNTPTPLQIGDRRLILQYGPRTEPLPFTMSLNDFVKQDYPGSQMAMAFESHVTVTPHGGEPFNFKIHMNHPYKQGGYKVYQSGFLSPTVTVLQVTKDPGLMPMYLACIGLVLGIIVTFYSRSLSWGHPDIPVPFPPSAEDGKAETEA